MIWFGRLLALSVLILAVAVGFALANQTAGTPRDDVPVIDLAEATPVSQQGSPPAGPPTATPVTEIVPVPVLPAADSVDYSSGDEDGDATDYPSTVDTSIPEPGSSSAETDDKDDTDPAPGPEPTTAAVGTEDDPDDEDDKEDDGDRDDD